MTEFVATYRLQLGPALDLAGARDLVDYLRALGVSHLYLSPIWQARAGSRHGYDVTDPTRISAELGGETAFRELASAGLGLILDVVPNHMAADASNPFWQDEASRRAVFDLDDETGFRRRFFDVDELVGVRVEKAEVFTLTQQKAIDLVAEGLADGLRIDHIDGLADPASYLDRLAARGVSHVWVEKILQSNEQLPAWPVEGTTGYDALNDLTRLFVDTSAELALTKLAREQRQFAEVAFEAKLEQATTTFEPEVTELEALGGGSEVAIALASLPVYRTYVQPGRYSPSSADRDALLHLPESVVSRFENDADNAPFVVRFQQTTGAVMAKGVEDTAFYRYVRLLALNEVGGDPALFGMPVDDFHSRNLRRLASHPRSLLASQTHDTKRSGDVRARLIALTYCVDEWVHAVESWHEVSLQHRLGATPDWTEELFIYQTLIGAWPISRDRLEPYLTKALREAKRNTNWIRPDETWEQGVIAFSEALAADPRFLASFVPFAERIALAGERTSLAELTLRLTSPGLPDIYQGDESWDIALVDPDNRRPVDWQAARSMLDALRDGAAVTRRNAKLFVTAELLRLRRDKFAAFAEHYAKADTAPGTCAYRRGDDVLVVVGVRNEPSEISAPNDSWRNLLEPLRGPYPQIPVAVFVRV